MFLGETSFPYDPFSHDYCLGFIFGNVLFLIYSFSVCV
jgi:hypothetical protein